MPCNVTGSVFHSACRSHSRIRESCNEFISALQQCMVTFQLGTKHQRPVIQSQTASALATVTPTNTLSRESSPFQLTTLVLLRRSYLQKQSATSTCVATARGSTASKPQPFDSTLQHHQNKKSRNQVGMSSTTTEPVRSLWHSSTELTFQLHGGYHLPITAGRLRRLVVMLKPKGFAMWEKRPSTGPWRVTRACTT